MAETAPISLRHSCGSELRVFPPLLEALTITSRSIDLAGVLAATRIASRSRDAVTTFGALPQSIQGQSNSRWTTSLGITLAQPHAVVRASPILAGTGSFIHLPDKEFRYLRTVIVTAAVYRGFISELAPLHLPFRHRAGVSPYTSAYALAETCVFSKQSDGPFLCGPRQLTE